MTHRQTAFLAYRQQLLVHCAYLSVLAVTSFFRWDSLGYDEVTYYVPAIRYVADRLPRVTLDYPFPGPPVGLLAQAVLYKTFPGRFHIVKLLSLGCAFSVGISTSYLILQESPLASGWSVFLMVTCFPFLLNCASQLKHHELTFACLILGYVFWRCYFLQGRYRYLAGAGLFFAAAAGTNQFAVVLPVALGLHVALKRTTRPKLPILLPCIVPVLLLSVLLLVWKGLEPPLYRAYPLEAGVGRLELRPRHITGAMFTVGVWLFPMLGVSSKDVKLAGWAFVPSIILVHFSGLYRTNAEFSDSLVGPISSLLRLVSLHNYPLSLLLVSVIVACGVSRTASLVRDDSRGLSLFAIYLGLFVVIIDFVPHYFESYYLYLIVPGYLLLLPELLAASRNKTAILCQLSAGVFGIAYSVLKAMN